MASDATAARADAHDMPRLESEILRRIHDAVVAIDDDARVTYWGPGAERLYGVAEGEALGSPLEKLYRFRWRSPEDERAASAALARDGFWRGENVPVLRAGEERHVESSVSVLAGRGGGRPGLLAVIRDVTDRVRAEEALRRAEECARRRASELDVVLDTVPAAVWIARDPESRRIDGNRLGIDLLRAPRGANVSMTAPAGERPRHFRAMRDGAEIPGDELPIQAAARLGAEIRGAEFDLVFDDGTVRHLLGNAAPLLDAEGRPRGAVGAFIDITDRKLAARQLAAEAEKRSRLHEAERRAREEAERIGETQRLMMGAVSHDLRSPLQVIRVAAGILLKHDGLVGAPAERAARIERNAGRMEAIMRDLLDYTRARQGEPLRVERRPVDLEAVCRRVLAEMRTVHGGRDVAFTACGPCAGAWDPDRIEQALTNLTSNALVHGGPRCRVAVALRGDAESVVCEVWNDGPPIPAGAQEAIFEPFRRAGGGASGLGLGLFIVREIARAHGGSVRVESSAGAGTSFRLRLPRS